MSSKIKQHTIQYMTSIAKQAIADVTHFLQTVWSQTVTVHNVEEDAAYQVYDVDLLRAVLVKGRLWLISVEIQGDTYHHTGNFFFETLNKKARAY